MMSCPVCRQNNKPTCKFCITCGASLTDVKLEILPSGTQLSDGEYIVDKVVGQGGFGITYFGNEPSLKRPVAIKEFFPEGCRRQGSTVISAGSWTVASYNQAKQRFLQEGQTLAQFNHPGIVRVFKYFEENNTAYIVMEYLQGKNLADLLEERGEPLKEWEAVSYVEKVSKALEVIHQANFLHLDIKPNNVMVTTDRRVVLVDFGAAKEYLTGKTQLLSRTVTPGYAPLEQYAERAKRAPYMDIYALAATMYHLLTGQMPISAPDRYAGVELPDVRQLNPKVRPFAAEAVMQGMAMEVKRRPQSVGEFLNLLHGREPSPSNPGARMEFYKPAKDPWGAFGEPDETSTDSSEKSSNWF
ncbi:serine/threonine protein kinase [Aerosakkonemataceae cyanobacterium BLCC-F50]|uniref:Serine/threonine protein kinase n=1 Tax=Floridaenema flaviceps BLCC-F50 TaxID=3153642 RepID=A0ABV4XIQ3_9CYAN